MRWGSVFFTFEVVSLLCISDTLKIHPFLQAIANITEVIYDFKGNIEISLDFFCLDGKKILFHTQKNVLKILRLLRSCSYLY